VAHEPLSSQASIRFGSFQLQVRSGELRKGATRLRVPDQSIQILLALVEQPGVLITRAQLRQRLWPSDTFVDFEHGLNAAVRRLRAALNDSAESPRFIETLPRRGYRFIGTIEADTPAAPVSARPLGEPIGTSAGRVADERTFMASSARRFPRRVQIGLATLAVVVIVLTGLASKIGYRPRTATTIDSLAVLPLLPLHEREADNYFGLGLADTIIARLNRTGRIQVRPVSAVRRFANGRVDAITAGKELQTDAVLEGTWIRDGNRLRVTTNLLRVADRRSLAAETFDVPGSDVFALQDQLAERLVSHLDLRLDANQRVALTRHGTANPLAYELYTKGLYIFSERGYTTDTRAASDTALTLFKRAVDADPGYALARAQLAFAYAWTAVFIEDAPGLIDRAKQELAAAEAIEDVPLIHLVRGFVLFTRYEGWRIREALREVKRAEHLDPRLTDLESAAIFYHVGLFDQHRTRVQRVLENDPTGVAAKRVAVNEFFLLNLPEDGLAAQKRLLGEGPDQRYFLLTRQVDRAAPIVERRARERPDDPSSQLDLARLRALQGRHVEAQAMLPGIVARAPRNRSYHHLTYDVARIYALGGDAERAVYWLNATIEDGFPCYPLFANDWHFERIRKSPAFQKTMESLRVEWESYKTEFDTP
jgi:TolB-like protein/DNA-binding winged helix-turn-helix (wHTH) protein